LGTLMMLFYFGTQRRRLFGIFEPAPVSARKMRAILLCHPMGNEQIFAYRSMRQLAARLGQAGFHVLRFDYYGTGDSYGETGDGDLETWSGDIETAIEELKDMTGTAKVSIIGLRLGANLASRATVRRLKDVNQLILWEPLASDRLACAGFESTEAQVGLNRQSDIVRDFSRGELRDRATSLPRDTLVLLTERPPSPEEFGTLAVEHVPDVSAWAEERLITGSIPAEALHDAVSWLK
jgi:pimeloyl-ACP methyl ester carboxylesterase